MGTVGFIGLGIMGRPMSLNLLKGNVEVMVYDIDKTAEAVLVNQGAIAGSLREIGKHCEIIFTILPNGEVVKEVLFGEDGLCSSMPSGSLIVDMSSATPFDSRYCALRLKEHSIGFLDAPVSGGEPKAIDGSLAIMVGGTQSDFDKALPYLSLMSASAVLVGEVGNGSTAKLVNQIIVNGTIALISEAFVFCTKAGADPLTVYSAIKDGLAGSTVLDAKLKMILDRNFTPGGKISINHKDIKNVMQTAHSIDCPVPLTANLFEILQSLKVNNQMDDDHAAIATYFERLAGTEVKPL
ncbi:MAG: NAD(P)-binding domain-containing protein [Oscillospiraceae bacterium]|nr:NAD(P)-binding domain-containing protein [Oscillospiraceae bacterium]